MSQGAGGWTPLKVIGVIFAALGMAGFGICSLCGFVLSSGDWDILWIALLGAGITALFTWMLVAIIRSARRDRKQDPGP